MTTTTAPSPARRSAVFVAVWLTGSVLVALPAAASITEYHAQHNSRLTVLDPFDTVDLDDFDGRDPLIGTATFLNTETLGSNQSAIDLEVSPDRIAATLTGTVATGGIARSRLDLDFTLDAPADVTLSGGANGFGPFSGSGSLTLRDQFANGNDFIYSLSSVDAVSWGTQDPIPLEAGTYELIAISGMSGGATGSRFNNVFVDFASGAGITGDYNDSGQVEQGDLDLVLQNWGVDTDAAGVPVGWTNDLPSGQIEQTELDGVLQNWGGTSAPEFGSSSVPEPAGLAWLAASVALMRRRAT